MHGRFGPADTQAGANSQVNYIYLLSPSCSWPTFWSSQIMAIIEMSTVGPLGGADGDPGAATINETLCSRALMSRSNK
jgi:hypothetical protein